MPDGAPPSFCLSRNFRISLNRFCALVREDLRSEIDVHEFLEALCFWRESSKELNEAWGVEVSLRRVEKMMAEHDDYVRSEA